jgi:hypothetical protein
MEQYTITLAIMMNDKTREDDAQTLSMNRAMKGRCKTKQAKMMC